MNNNIKLCPNQVVQFLQKAPKEFRKEDIIRFVNETESRWSTSCIRLTTTV